jgi:hypothetical protein
MIVASWLLLVSVALADPPWPGAGGPAPEPTAAELRSIGGDSFFSPNRGKERAAYKRALRRATRELFIYRGLETALILRGSYLSDAFRRDVARERGRLLAAGPDDQQAFERRLSEDGAVYHEVVFSADSALPRGDLFGGDGWQLRLIADGVEEKLVTVFKVERPTPLQNQIYTHQTLWSDLWVARFAKTKADPAMVELKVGGGYGNGAVVWRLR